MKIIFPIKKQQKYYDIHYLYILNIFKYMHCEIELRDLPEINETAFYCYIDCKKVIFDFSDSGESVNDSMYPVFKFHFREEHKQYKNIYPFCPVSFYDWNQFYELIDKIKYRAEGRVLNNQRIYGNAIERRTKVQNMLKEYNADFEITDQLTYWNKINNCLVSVHVPGQNENILDRSQIQLMAFGCATISPELLEIFPFNKKLTACKEYAFCKNDYSDLINIIDKIGYHHDWYMNIGKNVKQFFNDYCTPEKLVEWVRICLK